MKQYLLTPVFLMFALVLNAEVKPEFLQSLQNTDYQRIDSKIVGRAFHIYVKLPAGYDPASTRRYPTVYLLDGGELFPLFASYSRYLAFAEEIPDIILVGISYGSDSSVTGNFRSTDYTAPSSERSYWGGAGIYQNFLREELIPLIENRYRARSDRRIIFGQSLGGQFVLYTAQTNPELFWGHIASNPALHRNLPFFMQAHSTSEKVKDRTKLFVASGTEDSPAFRVPAMKWMTYWRDQKNLHWMLKTHELEGHSHMSAPPAAFRQGMRWLFE